MAAAVLHGQTQTSYSGYTVLTWTGTGSFNWTVPTGATNVEYLVVGGGGGGAVPALSGDNAAGGGGGGGQVRTGSMTVSPGQSITVQVGTGGVGAQRNRSGTLLRSATSGNQSRFGGVAASGGAVGTYSGGSSGSGNSGGSHTSGNNPSTNTRWSAAGGGGGAGGAGGSALSTRGGNGGNGVSSSIRTGSSQTYGGGGAGAWITLSINPEPSTTSRGTYTGGWGTGGGGNGGTTKADWGGVPAVVDVSNGQPNTGGGGGGNAARAPGDGAAWTSSGGNGGSGIVVVRYIYSAPPSVSTGSASGIGPNGATVSASLGSIGGTNVTQHGVVWSTSSNPTINLSTKTQRGSRTSTTSWSDSISGLAENTTYYVRAYASNAGGTTYGSQISFTTRTHAWAMEQDLAGIALVFAGGDSTASVTQNLGALPSSGGLYGSALSWTSSNSNLIRIDGPTAEVFRPWDADGSVLLTAIAARGGFTDTRTFSLVVKRQPVDLSADSIQSVLPQKIHIDESKRITVAGSGFRAYVDKSQIDFRVEKGAWSQSIPVGDVLIVNDATMVMTVPIDMDAPLGSYTLRLNHLTLPDIARIDAFEITNDAQFRAPKVAMLRIETDKAGVAVPYLEIQGEFEELSPGRFTVKGANQTLTINNILKLHVSGNSFDIDIRSGRQSIIGTGRFTLDARDRAGVTTTTELYSGLFNVDGFDLQFRFTGPPKVQDLFGQRLNIGATSMLFSAADTITMSGIMGFGINIPGLIGAEVTIDTLQGDLDGFDLIANFGVDVPFEMGPFEAPRIAIGINTITPEYAFGLGAKISGLGSGFDLDFTVRKGQLDKISFLIRQDIEAPAQGFKITSFGGGAENISDRTSGPLTFMALGNISDMVAPELAGNNLLNLADLRIGLSKAHLDASGSANIYGIVSIGSAEFVAVWNAGAHPRYVRNGFEFTGQTNILDTIVGKLNAAYWQGESFRGLYDARLQVPNTIPLIGGKALTKTTISTDAREARAEKSIIGIGFVVKYMYRGGSVGFEVSGALKAIADVAVAVGKAVAKAAKAAYEAAKRAAIAAAKAIYNAGKAVVDGAKKLYNSPAGQFTRKVVTGVAKKVGSSIKRGFSKLFCEEGRDAIAVYVNGEMFALIEVTGLVSEDLVIQAPDYDFVAEKADASRYFLTTSGYAGTAAGDLIPYDPATGVGNYLYLPDEGRAFVVMQLDQVGFWTFIDWGWFNHYTDPVERADVLNYASVTVYELTPGADMHFVVNNLLSEAEIPAIEFDADDRVVFEISSRSDAVVIRTPRGADFPVVFEQSSPARNAVHFPEMQKVYVVADVFAGEWEFHGEDVLDAGAFSVDSADRSLSDAEIIRRLINAPVTSQFEVTAANVADGQILLALDNAPADSVLRRPNGSEVPFVFSGPGANASVDEATGFIHALLPVGLADIGTWQLDAPFLIDNIYVVERPQTDTLSEVLGEIEASPTVYLAQFDFDRPGSWLIKVRGGASGIMVRATSGTAFSPSVVTVNEFGVNYTYLRIDVSSATVGPWEITTAAPPSIEAFHIWDASMDLAQLAALHRDGAPHSFVLEVNEIGRLMFEVEMDVPPALQDSFVLGDVIDSLVLIDYNGDQVAIELDENQPDWNAYYIEAERRLFIMADAFDAGYWHLHIDYGTRATVSPLTGDPANSMGDLVDLANGAMELTSTFELEQSGYHLFEIRGAEVSTRIRQPDATAPGRWNDLVLTADNARFVGDTLWVLVETVDTAAAQFWQVVSDADFAITRRFEGPSDPADPLTIGDVLDGEYVESIDLAPASRWAVNINGIPEAEANAVSVLGPDGTPYALSFLPAAAFDRAEEYPDANALYDADLERLVLRIEVAGDTGGDWQVILPSRRKLELFQLEFLPFVETLDVATVTGAGENVFDIDWRVLHPRMGSVVSLGLLSAAAVAEENFAAPALVEGLPTRGTTRVQAPQGLVPGDYHFVLYVENPGTGVMFEVHSDPVQITYASAPAAPVNLRVEGVGNGELTVSFDDGNFASVDRYYILTHLLEDGQTSASVPVLNFRGPALDFEPESGLVQSATLVGLESNRSYLVAAFAVSVLDPEEESFQFGLPSNVLEVYLPEPERPELTFSFAVPPGAQVNPLSYMVPVRSLDYDRDEQGDPIFDDALGEYRIVEVTTEVEERATLINSAEADFTVTVGNSPDMPSTFEFTFNDSLFETVSTPATTATFNLSGLTEGAHDLEILAVNAAGDRRVYSERLLVDLTAPHLFLFSPANGRIFFQNTVSITGETEPEANLIISLNGNPVDAGLIQRLNDGTFSAELESLAWDTLYTLEVRSTDDAGNAVGRTVQFYVLTPPVGLPVDNADIVTMGVQNATLNEPFSSTTLSYTASTSSSSVILQPATLSPTATVQVNVNDTGFVDVDPQEGVLAHLTSGSNTVVLKVTASDGTTTQDYHFTIEAPTQSTPAITTAPTASAIAYGLPLSQSTLSGGLASVPGEFFWANPATIPPAGLSLQSVTFTPDDEVNYSTVTLDVDVIALLASHVVITTQPVGGPSGDALALQPVVEIRDAADRLVTTDNTRTVTVSIASGSGGSLGGTQSITVSSGVGAFTDLALAGTVGTDYTLRFESSGITAATSGNVTVTPGAPSAATSTISASQVSVTVDETAGVQLTVQLRDAQDNLITTDAATVGVTSGFDFGSATAIAAVSYIGNGQYRASAASTRTGSASFGATVDGMQISETVGVEFLPSTPAEAIIDRQPVETVAGMPLHPSPRLIIRDRFGNPVAAGIEVRVSVAQGSGSIVSGESTTTVTTDAQGSATFSGLVIEQAEEAYQLQFSVEP